MNELGLPPLNAVEVGVIFAAVLLFSVVPTVLIWMEGLRERRAAALARAAALQALAPPEPTIVLDELDAPIAAELPAADDEAPPAVVVVSIEETVTEVALPVESAPAPAPEPIVAAESAGPAHEFVLDELRHARVLETPAGDVLADPARQQEWEEGLRLADAHAAAIGATPLSAPFEPQARSFAAMRNLGETKELRFLLFPTLWPTSLDQAAGQAIFELGSAGIVRAYVARV